MREFPIETRGVIALSLGTAAIEFEGNSNESRLTKNPYLHVVGSWRDARNRRTPKCLRPVATFWRPAKEKHLRLQGVRTASRHELGQTNVDTELA